MIKQIIFVISLLCFPLNIIAAEGDKNFALLINNMYVEADGNNRFEAQFKAYDISMRRALKIIADRMGIRGIDFKSVSYKQLEEAFEINGVNDPKYEHDWYSATINYRYDPKQIADIIIPLVPENSDAPIFNCLFIPIFKEDKKITLWNLKNPWLAYWDKVTPIIEKRKLFYPRNVVQDGKIFTPKNIFNKSYDSFLSLFPDKLFKSVLLLVSEYFTTDTGQTYMEVTYHVITSKGATQEVKRYNITNPEDMSRAIFTAADNAIDKLGIKLSKSVSETIALADKNHEEAKAKAQQHDVDSAFVEADKINEYKMSTEIYDAVSMEKLKTQLKSTKSIEHFLITKDRDDKYNVLIYTKDNIEQLTYNLYLNVLTYYNIDDEKHLYQNMSGV